MLNRVAQYVRKHNLLQPGDRVAAAASGGADSVALLELLLRLRERLGITLAVAHLNHGLRGAESDEDEQFVRDLAGRHELECFVEKACRAGGTPALPGTNLEAAARQERYAFFSRLVKQGLAGKVATAHTADDQAETVLGRLLRGSGTRGLAGIYPLRDGYVVRPLLEVRRSDLRAWALSEGLAWREDASNREPRFLRNRLRSELLPHLEKGYNPRVVPALCDLAEVARAEEQFWDARVSELVARLVEPTQEGWNLPLRSFVQLSEGEQRRLLRGILQKVRGHLRQVEFRHIEEARRLALGCQSGRQVLLPGCRVRRVFDALLFEGRGRGPAPTNAVPGNPRVGSATAAYQYSLDVPGVCTIPETGTRLCFKLVELGREAGGYNQWESVAALDALRNPVTVRNWRAGDIFQAVGGRKKLKALFVERRIPREQRLSWPVVTSGGELVWARGFPVARPFRWHPAGQTSAGALAGAGSGAAGILITEEEVVDGEASGSPPDRGADP